MSKLSDLTTDELEATAFAIDFFIDTLKAVIDDPDTVIEEKVDAAKNLKNATSALYKICKLAEDRGRSLLDADISLEDLGIFTNLK